LRITPYQFFGFGSNSMLINDFNDSLPDMDFMPRIPQAQQSRIIRQEFNFKKRQMSCRRLAKLSFVMLPKTVRRQGIGFRQLQRLLNTTDPILHTPTQMWSGAGFRPKRRTKDFPRTTRA